MQGNRTPHTDALSRGALAGLTLAHGRGHVFRSLMEGVAFGTRLILDTMAKAGFKPSRIAIAGGATRSPLWLQIHADVCGVPFVLTSQPEAPMLGCAILVGGGHVMAPGLRDDPSVMITSSKRSPEPRPCLSLLTREHGHDLRDHVAVSNTLPKRLSKRCYCTAKHTISSHPSSSVFFCPLQAAVAAGVHPSVQAAAGAMVSVTTTVTPRPEVHAAYQQPYQRYCQMYPALSPLKPTRAHTPTPTPTPTPAPVALPSGNQSVAAAETEAPHHDALLLAPSILAADFANLANEVSKPHCCDRSSLCIESPAAPARIQQSAPQGGV
jgi:sugar (pentulose or hexulose) kinase